MADEREQLLDEMRGWLERVAEARDYSVALDPRAAATAARLTDVIGDPDPDAWLVLGWLHWYRFQALPQGAGLDEFDAATKLFARCFVAAAGELDLPPQLLPILADLASAEAAELIERAMRTTNERLLNGVVQLWEHIVAATAPQHPAREQRLANLAGVLIVRARRTGAVADVERGMTILEEAAGRTPPGDPTLPGLLNNLSGAYSARFQLTGNDADLDAMIAGLRTALDVVPAQDPDRVMLRSNLGSALRTRSERFGDPADLDASVEELRAATQELDPADPHRPQYLASLGTSLVARFQRTGERADLDDGVAVMEQAVLATPADHADRPERLAELAVAASLRYTRFGATDELNRALALLTQAAQATPSDHPDQADTLANLGAAHMLRFERTGDLESLRLGVDAVSAAAAATPAGHPQRPARLSNLAATMLARFERTGHLPDLDAAIAAGREAVAGAPQGAGRDPASLSVVSGALHARFRHTGVLADLDAAIELQHAALDAAPVGDFYRPMFASNLGYSLWQRFGRSADRADLLDSIEAFRTAIAESPPDHPMRPMFLGNLSLLLTTAAEITGRVEDVDKAVSLSAEVVAMTAPGDPAYARRLSNLGNALDIRFRATQDGSYLDAAIEVGERALAVTPLDHPDRGARLSNHSVALRNRFELSGDPADLSLLLSTLHEAATLPSARPSVRVPLARVAADLLAAEGELDDAAALLELAVRLLPEMAPRQGGRGDRQDALSGTMGLAADAAALVLATSAPDRESRALRLLESGRAVLLGQALSMRTDISDLHARQPDLADRFVELRDRLDTNSTDLAPAGDASGEQATADRHRLAEELATLLETIRGLDGFASFALPPSLDELAAEATDGPVVVFSVSRYRSDALVLTGDGIRAVALPGLTFEALADRVNAFHEALDRAGDPSALLRERIAAQRALRGTLEWLWDSAMGPVLDALGYTTTPAPGEPWPRVWWSPGGVLGLLPIHAAGHHHDPGGGRTVLDRVVSSYTPTIQGLRHARARAGGPDSSRALVVAMPGTPGLESAGRLPQVLGEATLVADRFPGADLLIEPEDGAGTAMPTKANVLAGLRSCAVAHFACHASSDYEDPSRSTLFLHDHADDPLTVGSLAPVDLDRARLAYLSACGTAFAANVALVDEAIHLMSAFQLAGFPHVIGTQWRISDERAADIAGSFYAHLTADGAPAYRHAADALHRAVREMRGRFPAVPSLWAAFLHAGA